MIDAQDRLQKAQILETLPLARLEEEYKAERQAGTLEPELDSYYQSLLDLRSAEEVEAFSAMEPGDIVRQFHKAKREGRVSDAFAETVLQPLWAEKFKERRERSYSEAIKGVGDQIRQAGEGSLVAGVGTIAGQTAKEMYEGGQELAKATIEGTGVAGSDAQDRLKGGAKVAAMLESGARQSIGALARFQQFVIPGNSEAEQQLINFQRRIFGSAVPRAAEINSKFESGDVKSAFQLALDDAKAYDESTRAEGSLAKLVGLNATELEKDGVEFTEADVQAIEKGAEAASEIVEAAIPAHIAFNLAKRGGKVILRSSKTGRKIGALIDTVARKTAGATDVGTLSKKVETKTQEAERLAKEAARYNSGLKKARVAAGSASIEFGNYLQQQARRRTAGTAPGLLAAGTAWASGADPSEVLFAGIAGTMGSRALRNPVVKDALGKGLTEAGKVLRADLPQPLEKIRRAGLDFMADYKPVRAAFTGTAAGTVGSLPFAIGAETDAEAASSLISGAGFGAAGGLGQRVQAWGSDSLTKAGVAARGGAEAEVQGPVTVSAPTGVNATADGIHAQAEGILSQAGLRFVQQQREYVKKAADADYFVGASPQDMQALYQQFHKNPAGVSDFNGVFIPASQSKTGKPVVLAKVGTSASGHEVGHALFAAAEADPQTKPLVDAMRVAAARSLGAEFDPKTGKVKYSSPRLDALRQQYVDAHGQEVSWEYMIDENAAEHASVLFSGAPAGKLGGSKATSKSVSDLLVRVGDRMLGREVGLTDTGVTTSDVLPYSPSFDLLERIGEVIRARAYEESPDVPDASVEASPVQGDPNNVPDFRTNAQSGPVIVAAPGAPAAPATPPAAPTPRAPAGTVDVGVLNPVPVELTTDRSVGTNTPPAKPNGYDVPEASEEPAAAPAPAPAVRGPEVQAARVNLPAELTAEEKGRVAEAQPNEALRPAAEQMLSFAKGQQGSRVGAPLVEVNYRDSTIGEVFSKRVAPYDFSFNTTDKGVTILAFDLDRVNHSAKLMLDWAKQKGQPDRFGYASVDDPAFVKDLQTYLGNHARNLRGGGGELRVGGAKPAPKGDPVGTLPREKEQFFSMITGITPPVAPTRKTSVEAIARAAATARAGGVEPLSTETGSIEPNLLRQKLREEGAPVDRIGEDPLAGRTQGNTKDRNSIVMRMKLSGVESFKSTGQRIDLPNNQAAEASFMPSSAPQKLYHGTEAPGILKGTRKYKSRGGLYGDVVYLTDSFDEANNYAADRGGVVSVEARVERPAKLFAPIPAEVLSEVRKLVDEFNESGIDGENPVSVSSRTTLDEVYANFEADVSQKLANKLNKVLRRAGYDALWANNRERGSYNATDWVMPFSTENVVRSDTGARFQPASKRAANEDVRRIAKGYVSSEGLPYRPHEKAIPVNEGLAKRIADFYDRAVDQPNDPRVKAAYTALANETVKQWRAFEKEGYTAEPWTGEGQPYKDSAEMMADVRDNKHLFYFKTEDGFGLGGITPEMRSNPMLAESGVDFGGAKNVPVNDVFRVVHDIVGHGAHGYEFGPKGEFNAYLEHSRMFSDKAKPALAAETLAQNSWVNYGPHLRKPDGSLPKKGEQGYVPPAERRFADQKNIVVPPALVEEADAYAQAEGSKFMPARREDFSKERVQDLPNKSGWAIFTAENPKSYKDRGVEISTEENMRRNEKLRQDLEDEGLEFIPVKGSYGKPENSFIVLDEAMTIDKAAELARKYDQDSIFTRHGLVYQDGSVNPMRGIKTFDTRPNDYYTEHEGHFFSGDIDFDTKLSPGSIEGQSMRAEEALNLAGSAAGSFMPASIDAGGLKKFTEEADPLLKESDGTLKRWYHGSDKAGFMSFDLPQSGKTRGTGVFLTDSYRMASSYTRGNADVDTRRGEQILADWKVRGDRELPDGVEIKPEWAILRGRGRNVVESLSKDEFSSLAEARAEFESMGYSGSDLDSIHEVTRVLDADGYEDVYADEDALAEALDKARAKEPGVYELVVSAKSVMDIDWQGSNWDEGPKVWNILDEDGMPKDSLYSEDEKDAYLEENPNAQIEESQQYYSTDDAARQAKDVGYDAVLLRNVFDSGGYGRGGESGDVLVVFDPKNIKAPSSKNFDKADSDIRFMPAKSASPLARERVKGDDVQFKTSPKKGSVGGVVDVVHFSSQNLTSIDPKKSFGKGAATAADLQGEPKVFFYTKGTSYEHAIATRPNVYQAKIDGNALYDYNADPLDVRSIVNREKRDAAIRKAGFAGYYVETPGFDAVALFDKVKVQPALAADVMNRRQLVDTGREQATLRDQRAFAAEDRRIAREEAASERLRERTRKQVEKSPEYKAERKRLAGEIDEWKYEFGERMSDWVDAETERRLEQASARFMPAKTETAPEGWVSTRVPTGVRAEEDALRDNLIVGIDAMSQTPEVLKANARAIGRYPQLRLKTTSPAKIVAELKNLASSNLRFLHDAFTPEVRNRAKLWYVGARRIADRMSSEFNSTPEAAAGVLAALSPQKDWYMNVNLGERVFRGLERLRDGKVEARHLKWLDGKLAKDTPANAQKRALLAGIEGREFSSLDAVQKAMILRAEDELSGNRGYRIVTPEGELKDLVKKANGAPSKVAWGDFGSIAKAIRIASDPKRETISANLGQQHKVRNFYNNILIPDSPLGDVTVDTHAVAAALLAPLSGSSTEVLHNFGGGGVASSSLTGVQGTYAIYADAYREVAEELGILPRELQSITWEAVRGLFEDTFKTTENAAQIEALWKRYSSGEASLEETQKKIAELAGGVKLPTWIQ